MAVDVIEFKKFETSAQAAGTFTAVTLVEDPQPDDVVFIMVNDSIAGAMEGMGPPSGLAATWSSYVHGEFTSTGIPTNDMKSAFHIARDATTDGAITFNPSATFRGTIYMWLLRSDTADPISIIPKELSSGISTSTSLACAASPAEAGDLVIGVAYWTAATGTPSMTCSETISANSGAWWDSIFMESWAAWREVAGAETVTFTTTRTNAARGGVYSILVTDELDVPATPEITQYFTRAIPSGSPPTSWGIFFDQHEWQANDTIVVIQSMLSEADPDEYVVSGLGGTWTKTILWSATVGRTVMWIGKGMTSKGLINLAIGSPSQGSLMAFAVRGLASSLIEWASDQSADATERGNMPFPTLPANIGELVIAYRYYHSTGTGTSMAFPATKTPNDSGWRQHWLKSASSGHGQISIRAATGDAQDHTVTLTNGATTVNHTVAMVRLGVEIETIALTFEATSDLTIEVQKVPRRIEIRFDMQGPNLFANPTREGVDNTGWSSGARAAYTMAPGAPSPTGGGVQLSGSLGPGFVGTGIIGEGFIDIDPSKLTRYSMWVYNTMDPDWDPSFGSSLDIDPAPDAPPDVLAFHLDLPSKEWVYLQKEWIAEEDSDVAEFNVGIGWDDAPSGDNGIIHITHPSVTQETGPRSSLEITLGPRLLELTFEATSELLFSLPTDWVFPGGESELIVDTVRPIEVIFEAESDLQLSITAGLILTFDATSALNLQFSVSGDDRAAPIPIDGIEGSIQVDMSDATLEVGEDVPDEATRTIWFQWTPPDGDAEAVRFFSSDAHATMLVYDVDDIPVDIDDDHDAPLSLRLPVAPYLLQVGLRDIDPDEFTLQWEDCSPPDYDDVANALNIDYDYGGEFLTLRNATLEVGESTPSGATASVWATWDAEEDLTTDFTIKGYPSDVPFTVTVFEDDWTNSVGSVSGIGTLELSVAMTTGNYYWLQIAAVSDQLDLELSWYLSGELAEIAEAVDYLRAEVYESDGVTFISEVPRRFGSNAQEPLNVAGVGSMGMRLDDTLLHQDAYPDLLEFGHIVKFFLGDECIHGFRIKGKNTTFVSTDEWKGYVKTVTGPSVHHLFDDFMVQHDLPLIDRRLNVRSFTWAAPASAWYDGDDWISTYNTDSQLDPPGNFDRIPSERVRWKNPPKFPDPEAKWMWVSQDPEMNEDNFDPGGAMKGFRFYRNTFTLAKKDVFRIYASADESYTIWLDGEEVLSGTGEETGYTQLEKRKLKIEAGEHTIAVKQIVDGQVTADGVDAFIFTLMKVKEDGKPGQVILRSDGSWMTTYLRPVPTWNRANVLRKVVIEAQDRFNASALSLDFDFTGARDSDNWRWRDRYNEEVGIGTTVLELQNMLSEGNNFDVWVRPADMKIQAWRRRGTDKSKSVTLEPGRNLLDWSVDEVEEVRNDYLVQYDGGWFRWKMGNSIDRYGGRESYVTMGRARTDNDAKALLKKAARGIGWAQKQAGTSDFKKWEEGDPSGSIIAVDGARPFLDFGVGDIIKAPNENGVLRKHRVLSLTLMEDDRGMLTYDADLEEL